MTLRVESATRPRGARPIERKEERLRRKSSRRPTKSNARCSVRSRSKLRPTCQSSPCSAWKDDCLSPWLGIVRAPIRGGFTFCHADADKQPKRNQAHIAPSFDWRTSEHYRDKSSLNALWPPDARQQILGNLQFVIRSLEDNGLDDPVTPGATDMRRSGNRKMRGFFGLVRP
jgi:hypothetical protein